LYVGKTDDLANRERVHNAGHGAVYTASRRPVLIIDAEEHPSNVCAARREQQIKRWSAARKEALVSGRLRGFTTRSRVRPTVTWLDLLKKR
jgi:predicted GIY-YIG superfamily endonuclease